MSASGADNRRPQVCPWHQGLFSVWCTRLHGQQPGCSAPGRVRGGVSAQTYVIRLFLPAGVVAFSLKKQGERLKLRKSKTQEEFIDFAFANNDEPRDEKLGACLAPCLPLLPALLPSLVAQVPLIPRSFLTLSCPASVRSRLLDPRRVSSFVPSPGLILSLHRPQSRKADPPAEALHARHVLRPALPVLL